MNNKKNMKKIIIVVLFLFTIIGLVGYGVYSYYYTTGTFTTSASVSIGVFDPQTIIDGNSDFLGAGGTLKLVCPPLETGTEESIDCTGSITVKNNGSGNISIEVYDASGFGTVDYSSGNGPMSLDSENITTGFNWTTKTLTPNETAVLTATVSVPLEIVYGSDEPEEWAGEETGEISSTGTAKVDVSFKLKASQVYNH